MSERKSWDIVRKPQAKPVPAQAPARETVRRRPPAPIELKRVPKKNVEEDEPVRKVESPRPKKLPSEPLKARRKSARNRSRFLIGLLLVALIAGTSYTLWLPSMRVSEVTATGPDAQGAKKLMQQTLSGSYLYILPRNSVFFFPQAQARAAILAAYPDVDAIQISRSTFHSLSVTTIERATAFVWCGESVDVPYMGGLCFNANAQGLIFATSTDATVGTVPVTDTASTSSSTPSNPSEMPPKNDSSTLRIFGGLSGNLPLGASPVRMYVTDAGNIPNALQFVKIVRQLGVPVSALVLRGDEADLWLNGPTRITYVIGHEESAAALATAALPHLTLTNGTIQYVDLRFDGKVFIKRYGNDTETLQ